MLDKHCPGMSYSAAGPEFIVSESTNSKVSLNSNL